MSGVLETTVITSQLVFTVRRIYVRNLINVFSFMIFGMKNIFGRDLIFWCENLKTSEILVDSRAIVYYSAVLKLFRPHLSE